jgi:site-specific recombinase XerD
MATIFKRGNKWYLNYTINGKRHKKSVGKSKEVAQLALKDIEVKIAKGDFGFLPKDSEIGKLYQRFEKHSATHHSKSTVKRYHAILDNFKNYLITNSPHIKKISQLSTTTFEDYKHYRKSQNAKPKTINIELQMLHSLFALGQQWGYVANNPLKNVQKLKITKQQEARFLTKEECNVLLSNSDKWLYPILFTFLNTGLRKQELMNLEWKDIDCSRKIIKIRAKESWSPKTDEREVPINQNLLDLLTKHKKTQKGDLVFHDSEGNKIGDNKLRKELIKLTKKCGFPDVTKIHSLRHTFASHLVMKGVDIPTVSKLLGHKDIATTMIYSHLAPSHLAKAVEKL